jgi:hypothetical protein
MKTAEGTVEFSAPQVRDTPEPFVSEIREDLTGRTQSRFILSATSRRRMPLKPLS